ncbi:CGNR zinc finger domain-containing protein [Kitasatospora sp. NPDC059571]|uniref:CGNR zinc finger domain-containing protein n=1 Tax=Kitasatospora sp. NPDC059571 TaxID=3346871 RepID=UPI00369184C0
MTSATAPPRRFRTGSGRICLDYLRTLRLRGSADAAEELDGPEALADWVRQLGPYAAGAAVPAPAPDTLEAARELREAVHALLTAARSGGGPAGCPAGARETVNGFAAHPVPVPALDGRGVLRHEAARPVDAVLAAIARDALELATSPALARVRECAGENCAAWFLDTSRPGSRRWCSMDSCGNQAKKQSLRAKRAAGEAH